jgi:hypothetical protein
MTWHKESTVIENKQAVLLVKYVLNNSEPEEGIFECSLCVHFS